MNIKSKAFALLLNIVIMIQLLPFSIEGNNFIMQKPISNASENMPYRTLVNDKFESKSNLFDDGEDISDNSFDIGYTHSIKNSINSLPFEKTYLFTSSTNSDWNSAWSATQEGGNCFVETEFDIRFDKICKIKGTYYVSLTSDVIAPLMETTGFAVLKFNGATSNIECNNTIISTFKDREWYRVKVVSKITDSNKNETKKINSIFINGINVLSQPFNFSSVSAQKIPYYNLLQIIGSKSTGDYLCIDNFSVYKYNSDNGVSPLVNKGSLITAIRKTQNRLNETKDYENAQKYTQLNGAFSSAKAIYQNELATQSEVDAKALSLIQLLENYWFNLGSVNIESISFIDKDGISREYMPSGGILDKITFSNNTSTSINTFCYVGIYSSENKLMNLKLVTLIIDDAEKHSILVNLALPNAVDEYKIKVFSFGSDLDPFMKTVEINGDIINQADWKIYINSLEYAFDTKVKMYYNGTINVSVSNLCNILGISFHRYDNYFIAERSDGRQVKFTPNSNVIEVDGIKSNMKNQAFLYQGALLIAPLSTIANAFDLDCTINETEHTLSINSNYQENFRTALSNEITCTSEKYYARFNIPYPNPSAKAEVWVRMNENSLLNWPNTPTTGLVNLRMIDEGFGNFVWRKVYSAKYSGTAFKGTIGNIRKGGRSYDVKVKITDGLNVDTFVKLNAFSSKSEVLTTKDQLKVTTNGELVLIPTYANMSYYVDIPSTAKSCQISYKKTSDTQWEQAYEPYIDTDINQFMGSIVGLEENQSYDVKAVILDELNNMISTKTQTIKTWSETPNISQTLSLDDVYSDSGPLILEGINGTSSNWIKIDGGGRTIDAGKNTLDGVYISDCSYLILENIVVCGGYLNGMNITGASQNIRIKNCDISTWGRLGIFNNDTGLYYADGLPPNYDAGIKILDVSNITIENCYIHDAFGKTNSWDGDSWANVHPNGTCGIVYRANKGLVIRYNDIVGNDENKWNDAMECYQNGLRLSGPGFDGDVYGNLLANAQDDGMEVDSGGRNIRIYNNQIANALCGISTAPLMWGPTYIFRNLVTDVGTVIKAGGSPDLKFGIQYLFHNTFDVNGVGVSDIGYSSNKEYHMVSRNNIIVSRKKYGAMAIRNTLTNASDSSDYDLLYGKFTGKALDEGNGNFGLPTYDDFEKGIFTLRSDSIGIDNGTILPNFNSNKFVGAAPDRGAFEYGGSTKWLPYRPIDIVSNMNKINLKADEMVTLLFNTGVIPTGVQYSIKKSVKEDWLLIDGDALSGALLSNSSFAFHVSVDSSKLNSVKANATILFRTSTGYSLPVIVSVYK